MKAWNVTFKVLNFLDIQLSAIQCIKHSNNKYLQMTSCKRRDYVEIINYNFKCSLSYLERCKEKWRCFRIIIHS